MFRMFLVAITLFLLSNQPTYAEYIDRENVQFKINSNWKVTSSKAGNTNMHIFDYKNDLPSIVFVRTKDVAHDIDHLAKSHLEHIDNNLKKRCKTCMFVPSPIQKSKQIISSIRFDVRIVEGVIQNLAPPRDHAFMRNAIFVGNHGSDYIVLTITYDPKNKEIVSNFIKDIKIN